MGLGGGNWRRGVPLNGSTPLLQVVLGTLWRRATVKIPYIYLLFNGVPS